MTIHPIFFSCYKSAFEFYSTILLYGLTFMDWRNLVYNLIHNLGYIYDSIYYLVVHHIKGDSLKMMEPHDREIWWFKLGIYYGNIIYHILYSNVTTLDKYDPLAGIFGVKPSWIQDVSDPVPDDTNTEVPTA